MQFYFEFAKSSEFNVDGLYSIHDVEHHIHGSMTIAMYWLALNNTAPPEYLHHNPNIQSLPENRTIAMRWLSSINVAGNMPFWMLSGYDSSLSDINGVTLAMMWYMSPTLYKLPLDSCLIAHDPYITADKITLRSYTSPKEVRTYYNMTVFEIWAITRGNIDVPAWASIM